MSNQIQLVQSAIGSTKSHFEAVNALHFSTEEHFAIQMLSANDFSMKIATNNQLSVQNAMRNVASIGLSLNPANSHAYLVPRGGEICLDISYTGLIALATQSGAIDFVSVEVVYENEQFQLNGHNKPPTHTYNPFNREGQIIGVYCVTQLAKGGVMVTSMSRKDVDEIKVLSAGSNKPNSPWNKFYGEMAKKCVIKRAAKTWPQASQQLSNAIHYLNNEGGEGIVTQKAAPKVNVVNSEPSLEMSKEKIDDLCKKAFERQKVEQARQYFKDNLSDKVLLEYALQQLSTN